MSTYLYGKVLDFDKTNQNKRFYPKEEVLKAVEKYNTKSEQLSEVMPMFRGPQINLDNVGAICEGLYIVGNSLYAQLRILDVKNSNFMISVLQDEGKAMLSLRGNVSPTFVENDVLYVKDLEIISIDVIPFDGFDENSVCVLQQCLSK